MTYTIDEKHLLYPIADALQRAKNIEELHKELTWIREAIEEAGKEPTEALMPKDDRVLRMIHAAKFCMSERIPYVFGGTMNHATESKRGAYDCSAFVQALYRSIGTSLPRTTKDQIKKGRQVTFTEIKPGDLIFYDTTGKKEQVNHVALYIGNREMIHTNSPSDGINMQNVDTGKHAKWMIQVRRILPDEALNGY